VSFDGTSVKICNWLWGWSRVM